MTCVFLLLIVRDRPRWRGGVYLLLPFLDMGFLEIAATLDPNGFPAARPFSHGRKQGTMHRKSSTEKMGRWHGPQTQHEVVTHVRSQAYTKQIHENCCKRCKRHVRIHSGLGCCTNINALTHADHTQSDEQVLRCVLIDRRYHRVLEQLNQNLDVCKEKRNQTTFDLSHQDVCEGRPLRQFAKRTAWCTWCQPRAWQPTRRYLREGWSETSTGAVQGYGHRHKVMTRNQEAMVP